jgi:hypothetical protein
MMFKGRACARRLALAAVIAVTSLAAGAQGQTTAPGVRKIGTVQSITGNTLVLKLDNGSDINIAVADATRIVRLAPGSSDIKTATPMELKDLQVGDRMLVRAPAEADPLQASTIVVMKKDELAQKQQQDRLDWQRRGVGGIVTAIDAATGDITVSVTPVLNFLVKTTPSTVFLRYDPSSVKFSDAKRGTFDQIKTGDQLRAKGNRSADGKEIAAEEIVSGTFRNIAGTVTAVDAGKSTVTVKDVISKKSVVIKITSDSLMRKLTPEMARGLASLLKGAGGGESASTPGGASGPGGPGTPGQGGRGPRGGGMEQMLSRVPAITISDLQKEDAVMVVSTNGGSEVSAITLLSGVEPILTASPNGMSAAALLSGWNLGVPGGDAGPQ